MYILFFHSADYMSFTESADKSMRITIKNDSKPSETKPNGGPTEAELPVPPASKKIKVEKGTGNGKNNQDKKSSKKRKDSSSESADSSDSSKDSSESSGSGSENEN